MAAMPFARLKRCLEVAVLYSSQQADVNVALTTISLLWNAADMFGKAGARAAAARPTSAGVAVAAAAAEDESDTEVEAAVVALPAAENGEGEDSGSEDEAASSSGKSRGLLAELSPVQTEDLLQMIFLALQVGVSAGLGGTLAYCVLHVVMSGRAAMCSALRPAWAGLRAACSLQAAHNSHLATCRNLPSSLQAVSQDVRPEVRNSGVRTLFAVVVNQGPRLSRTLWEQCLWEMLFPLLNHAYLMSATASRDEVRQGCVLVWLLAPQLCKQAPSWVLMACTNVAPRAAIAGHLTLRARQVAHPLPGTPLPLPRRSRWCWGSHAARRSA